MTPTDNSPLLLFGNKRLLLSPIGRTRRRRRIEKRDGRQRRQRRRPRINHSAADRARYTVADNVIAPVSITP